MPERVTRYDEQLHWSCPASRINARLSREQFEQLIEEAAFSAMVSPKFVAGRLEGLRVREEAAREALNLGMYPGDLLSGINGIPISAGARLTHALEQALDARCMELELLRAGEKQRVVVVVAGDDSPRLPTRPDCARAEARVLGPAFFARHDCPGNVNCISAQARIAPAFRDGAAIGFKLFGIHPNSVYPELGFQDGDVIRSINGLPVESPDKALDAYSLLKEFDCFEVEFERRGELMRAWFRVVRE